MRGVTVRPLSASGQPFPFLFGGTFIEGPYTSCRHNLHQPFPFLFGGTFIEGVEAVIAALADEEFPFLFGGTFIEGLRMRLRARARWRYFPSFSEGLSLREFTRSYSAIRVSNFPSFSEGLSLRVSDCFHFVCIALFPFLFGGTFIEGFDEMQI